MTELQQRLDAVAVLAATLPQVAILVALVAALAVIMRAAR